MHKSNKHMIGILVGGLMLSGATADADPDLFAGLMPGEAISDEELGLHFGAATINFTLEGGSVLSNGGSIDPSLINSLGSGVFSGGINNVMQFQGDQNMVNTTINIEVNINSVKVIDSLGANVEVIQTLDFGGGVVGGFVQ